ncbi:MAG: NAD-dependent succinate-semialdehyde dehydrogenase [Chitinophagales bacterium]|nr:NAD-dependent succinate-semialdehyde dehydrogenase [Chitinophagales bacterium]MDW8428625.1 NAD-dependent succinate-semialdehyde dehydrogenase [Chitinophagales bacterium]
MANVFYSINPYNQQVFAEHPVTDVRGIGQALEAATQGWLHWKNLPVSRRGLYLQALADELEKAKEELALLMAKEMGKVLREGRAEIDKCVTACRYFAEHAELFLRDEPISCEAQRALVCYEPLGIILGIMPWNFPFWQVLRAAAPALMAGNVFLLKHAPNVCACSKRLEQLFQQADFPEGVFQALIIDVDQVPQIIAHPLVRGVTLTGSERAGAAVASLAGVHIKKTVLELGGSDPFLVLDDAPLEEAAQVALQSRLQNAGQSCIAAKRLLVAESIYKPFVDLLLEGLKQFRQGNPLEEGVALGPMARLDLAEKLEQQQNRSVQMGAQVLAGGQRHGCNYAPTLLASVHTDQPAFQEELFGPVAVVIPVRDDAQAVALANQSRYGLGATIWTRNRQRAEQLARRLECGGVFVNTLMRSDVRFPFGGMKSSGYGRELGRHGMLEFTNIKTIYIN